MANPLKILTVLTASQAAQFKEAVELSGAVTARDGVEVTGGDLLVSAGNVSASGGAEVGDYFYAAGQADFDSKAFFWQGLGVEGQKITSLADGTETTDAVAFGQLTQLSESVSSSLAAEAQARADEDLTFLKLDGSRPMEADLDMSGSNVTNVQNVYGNAQLGVYADNVFIDAAVTDITVQAISGTVYVTGDRTDIRSDGDVLSLKSLNSYVDISGSDHVAVAAPQIWVFGDVSASADLLMGGDLTVEGSANLMLGADVNGAKITSLAEGTEATDAVNYGQLTASIDAEAQARADEDLTFLKLDGSRAMSGALDMGGYDIVSAQSGAFSADVSVGGKLTVLGGLQVDGTLTYVNTTNLDVTDALVTLAKGAVDGASADGAGIQIDGANATLTYAADDAGAGGGEHWVANKGLHVQGNTYINGVLTVSGSNINFADGSKTVLAVPYDNDQEVVIGGSFQTSSIGSTLFKVVNDMVLGGDQFSYITTPVSDGLYNVDDAIHALDVAVSGAANANNAFKVSYNDRRVVYTGSLSSGQAIVNLQTVGGALFAAAELANIALDVMVDADNTGFTNDLVAIKMYVDGADVKVQIDAPATPSAAFRLIAVNEQDIA